MSRAEAQRADPAAVFAALGDRTRMALVIALSDGEARSIASLSSGGALSRQAVTKHLRVLEQAGLVTSVRAGRESRFAYRPQAMNDARSWIDEVSAQWGGALQRLKAFVEKDA